MTAPHTDAGAARLADKFSCAREHRRYNDPATWFPRVRYYRQWRVIVLTLGLLSHPRVLPLSWYSLAKGRMGQVGCPLGWIPCSVVEENRVS
ncbi:MAG: hypothetical protein H5T68_00290 [Chloroflexi bacterium]|nr:hypothetical protein [Chloroflexota bacterium]